MMKMQPVTHFLLPQPDYSFSGDRQNISLGEHSPLSSEVMRPLNRMGMCNAVITKRRDFRSKRSPRDHTFILFLDGQMTIEMDGTAYTISPGDLIFYPFGTTTLFSCPGNSWYLYLTFDETPFLAPLAERGPQVRAYESAELFYLLMDRIASAYENPTTLALDFAERDAMMLANLLRREVALVAHKPSKQQKSLHLLVERIREEPQADWTLAAIANELNVSTRTLMRIFKAEYGTSPIDMVVRERLARAHQMLGETDMKLANVAKAVGYDSVSSFSTLFKKHYGERPGRYRAGIRRD